MKPRIRDFLNRISAFLAGSKKLAYISLAAWISHILLRVMLLFRGNPYGFPFVSKPDWYIFHAVCIDFLWICNALVGFLVIDAGVNALLAHRQNVSGKKIRGQSIITILYAVFHALILPFTLLDNEFQRFLGCHFSFGLLDTYKDTSSLVMLWDYVANDYSVPYLQFVVLAGILPLTYALYRLLRSRSISISRLALGMTGFYVASFLFVHFIWTGNARMTKLKPVVSIVSGELFGQARGESLSEAEAKKLGAFYQTLWTQIEADSLWTFPEDARQPLYRIPSDALLRDSALRERRAQKPNFIVVFMESHRGMNTGFLNPEHPSPTPYYDSLAAHSRIWERMHTGGLPTTGGVLSSHIGIPHHSSRAQATELAHVNLPSYASVLKDSGYTAHYFSAADPAWDNLSVWMSKWYTAQHYDRNREDDSTFFDHAISYVVDTLGTQDRPFLATLMTRSNHYPFNFAAGLTEEQKQAPLTERIHYTMSYADRQLARFMHAIEKQPWYANTYVIILADHGFPLGENGVSTMNGGAFSNATWIPFLIHGQGIEAARDTATAGQIDLAPTLLELAGIATPNVFMGHNLLRGYGSGLSLGAYSRVAALGYNGHRLIVRQPLASGEVSGLFAEGDTHQEKDLQEDLPEETRRLKGTLDSLIKIADFTLEHGI